MFEIRGICSGENHVDILDYNIKDILFVTKNKRFATDAVKG